MKEKTKKRLKGLYNFFKVSTGIAAGVGAEALISTIVTKTANEMVVGATGIKGNVQKIVLAAGVGGLSMAAGYATVRAIDEGFKSCEELVTSTKNAKEANKKFKEITDLTDEAIQVGVDIDRLREICDKIGEAKNMKYTDGLIEYLDIIIFELKAEICGVEAEDAENEETAD